MKYKFAFTIGAIKDVCERCPNHDVDKIVELFSDNDYVKTLDNMIWFIVTLNKWAVFRDTRSFDGALTEDDVAVMDMNEVNELFAEAMSAFRGDKKSDTEIEPTKKAKAVPGNDT